MENIAGLPVYFVSPLTLGPSCHSLHSNSYVHLPNLGDIAHVRFKQTPFFGEKEKPGSAVKRNSGNLQNLPMWIVPLFQ
jgi:hypothetical protein